MSFSQLRWVAAQRKQELIRNEFTPEALKCQDHAASVQVRGNPLTNVCRPHILAMGFCHRQTRCGDFSLPMITVRCQSWLILQERQRANPMNLHQLVVNKKPTFEGGGNGNE
jgi:hypothetical protein